MKKIKLTREMVALVDDEDFDWLNQWKWHAIGGSRNTYYAARDVRRNSIRETIYMHRLILKASDGLFVDHKDMNGLNNQRENIRVCTRSENHYNRRSQKNSSSKFKGVSWDRNAKRWSAYISEKSKKIHLGLFDAEVDAAMAFNKKAIEIHGEFVNLNIL